MPKLIKLYRNFEIKWDKDRQYVVIGPLGKLVQEHLKTVAGAERYVDNMVGPPAQSERPAPKPQPKTPPPEPTKRTEPPPPCERCGAEHKSLTAFRKEGLCGSCWIEAWTEQRASP